MAEIIDIKKFDMANEKVVQTTFLYVELGDNYLLYAGQYYSSKPKGTDPDDHSLGWEDEYVNFRNKVKRELIVSIDKIYSEKYDNWRVEIEINGYPSPIRLYFETESEVDVMYKKLDEFIFGK